MSAGVTQDRTAFPVMLRRFQFVRDFWKSILGATEVKDIAGARMGLMVSQMFKFLIIVTMVLVLLGAGLKRLNMATVTQRSYSRLMEPYALTLLWFIQLLCTAVVRFLLVEPH